MTWRTQRRLIYGVAVIFVVASAVLYIYRDNFFPVPTCFDKKQNGYESGIDCGGTCSLRCTQEVSPLTVLWSRALKTSNNTYDLVTMVSNKNINNASRALGYTFNVYDGYGSLVTTISGTTTAPVDSDFPIIVQNVTLTKRPKDVVTQLMDGPHYTVKELPTSPTIRQTSVHYEAGDIPRVYATITNTKRITISNLPVRVVLFDEFNNALGVGQTIIPFLDKEGVQEISFTWDAPFAKDPSKIIIYPIFDPFLSN